MPTSQAVIDVRSEWALAVKSVAGCMQVLSSAPTHRWCQDIDRELKRIVTSGEHVLRTNVEVLLLAHDRAYPNAPSRCVAEIPSVHACQGCAMAREDFAPHALPTAHCEAAPAFARGSH